MPADLSQFPIRRNVLLLAGSMAAMSGMLQLVAAVSSITFVQVAGVEGLLGLGPAITLATAAVAAFQAGRAMDRFGRVPVLAVGFVIGALGTTTTGLGCRLVATPLVLAGLLLIGVSMGTITLVRTAGGDMFPPERRARGIAFVLSGAVFGAVLGPAVFGPLFAGRELTPEELAVPWFAAGGFALVGLVLVLCVRPDPRRIAEIIAADGHPDPPPPPAAVPVRQIVRRPGVAPALVGALASFGVMVSVMNLTGYVVVNEHGHHQADVFPIIGAHVLGMYALVLVVGPLIDRIGRRTPLIGGLVLMGAACAGMLWAESVWATAALLGALGLGWNLSFVAASAELVDRTRPSERGRLLGFSDQLSGVLGATLALAGGVALDVIGVAALAIGAAALVALPALWIIGRGVAEATPEPAEGAA